MLERLRAATQATLTELAAARPYPVLSRLAGLMSVAAPPAPRPAVRRRRRRAPPRQPRVRTKPPRRD